MVKHFFKQTGTTIAALKFNRGIIILADTRSTSGPFVANKHILKISKITNNIYTAGAGTAADTFRVCKEFGSKLRIYEKKFERLPSIKHFETIVTNHLHSYGGYISAALICGGVDDDGPKIISIQPHGSSSNEEYAVNGSGSYAAIGVLEALYKKNLEKEEALQIGIKTIEAGVKNDLYSGTGVDYVIVYYKTCKENANCLKKNCIDDKCEIGVESERVELDLDVKSEGKKEISEKFKKESLIVLEEEVIKFN